MKKVALLLVVALCLAISQSTKAQNLIPPLNIGRAKVSFWGFSQALFENAAEREVQWYKGRLYAKIEGFPVTIFVQTQPIDKGNPSSNFLQQLCAEYQIKGWTLKGGRICVTRGWVTPVPSRIKTVRYPRVPGSFYAYGIQAGRDISRFYFSTDVTGATDKVFYKNSNFDRVEFSGRISGPLYGVATAITTQLSQDFKGFVLDAERKIGSVTCKGALYIADQEVEEVTIDSRGGYLLAVLSPLSWLELHSQADYRRDVPESNSARSSTIWTNGLGIRLKDNRIALTVDYVSQTHRPVARLQFQY